MYSLVIDEKEKEMLLKTFSGLVNRTCLEHFAEQNGYGDEFIRILFKGNLDEYEDQLELQEMSDNQVVLFAEYPAAPTDEKLYLTFKELYGYVEKVVQENDSNNGNLQELLLEVKKELAI